MEDIRQKLMAFFQVVQASIAALLPRALYQNIREGDLDN